MTFCRWILALSIALNFLNIKSANARSGDEYQRALTAMQADPSDLQAAFEFAGVAARAGDFANAISTLERMLRIDPARSNLKADLGYLYLVSGNPAAAERYLREAKAAGEIPAIVDRQIDELIALAVAAQRSTRVSGQVLAGLQYETNANGGPDGIPELITGAEEADVSLLFSGRAQYIHDLGFQNGTAINAGLQIHSTQYGKDSSPEITSVRVQPGVSVPVGDAGLFTSYLSAGFLTLRGDSYRRAIGGGVSVVNRIGPSEVFQLQIEIDDLSYFNSEDNRFATNQDGTLRSLALGYQWAVSDHTSLTAKSTVHALNAQAGWEGYTRYGLSASVERKIAGVEGSWWGRPLTVGGRVELSRSDYDDPDPFVSTTLSRRDNRVSAELFGSVELDKRVSALASLRWVDNTSNYRFEQYDSLGVFVGLSMAFGDN